MNDFSIKYTLIKEMSPNSRERERERWLEKERERCQFIKY